MPQLDLDGANSKISADTIRGQSGTTVTVQSGHNLVGSGSGLTALPAGNLTGTVADARISALTASKLTGALPAISGASLTGISSGPTLGTLVTPTPAGSATFSSIPSGTKCVIISWNEISTSHTCALQVQLGDSGGFESSGYLSTSLEHNTSTITHENETSCFIVRINDAARVLSGHMMLTLLDASSNLWVSSHTAKISTNRINVGGGSKSLSAELTQLYMTLSTNAYDAGSINIMYW